MNLAQITQKYLALLLAGGLVVACSSCFDGSTLYAEDDDSISQPEANEARSEVQKEGESSELDSSGTEVKSPGVKKKRPLEDPRTYPLMVLLITFSMVGLIVLMGIIMVGRRHREQALQQKGSFTRLDDMSEFSDEERKLKAIIEAEKKAMEEGR